MPHREDGLLTNSSALYSGYGLGDDWFEGALLRPDLVLSDVARAINSSNVPQVTPHLLVTLFAANSAFTVRLDGQMKRKEHCLPLGSHIGVLVGWQLGPNMVHALFTGAFVMVECAVLDESGKHLECSL